MMPVPTATTAPACSHSDCTWRAARTGSQITVPAASLFTPISYGLRVSADFGNPQVTFAGEIQIDEIAETLGLDPFEVRMRNAICTGDKWVGGQRWLRPPDLLNV